MKFYILLLVGKILLLMELLAKLSTDSVPIEILKSINYVLTDELLNNNMGNDSIDRNTAMSSEPTISEFGYHV